MSLWFVWGNIFVDIPGIFPYPIVNLQTGSCFRTWKHSSLPTHSQGWEIIGHYCLLCENFLQSKDSRSTDLILNSLLETIRVFPSNLTGAKTQMFCQHHTKRTSVLICLGWQKLSERITIKGLSSWWFPKDIFGSLSFHGYMDKKLRCDCLWHNS